MTPRVRIAVRIPVPLKEDLDALARQRRSARTDLVMAGIQLLVNAEAPAPAVAHRLDRLLREMRALQQAMAVMEETLGLFINVYFSTTTEVPPDQEEAARRLGGRRYARFLKILETKLATARRVVTTEGRQDEPAAAPESAGARAGDADRGAGARRHVAP